LNPSSRRTIQHIASHELRNHWRDGTLPIAVILMTLLLLVSALTTHQNQQRREEQQTSYQSIVRKNWVEQPDRHPHRASHYGYLAFRPPGAVSFLDQGVESFVGNSIFLEAHRQNPANFSEASLTGGLMRFGILSPATLILLLAPLILFFLGYGIISGERENGTLPLLLAQGATPRQILFGKCGALFIMGLALIIPGLVPMTILAGMATSTRPGEFIWRLGGLGIGYAGYLLSCALLCVIVSTICRRSRTALIILIIGWVLGGIFMPRSLAALGEGRAPLPSRAEFEARLDHELEREGDSHDPDDPHFRRLREVTLERYKVGRVEDLPFNYGAFVMLEAEKISSAIFRRHYLELLETMERQNRPAIPAGLINPYLAIRPISTAFAGTDHHHFARFQQQAEDFRYSMIQRLNTLHLEEIAYQNDRTQRVSRAHWDDFPEFIPTSTTFREVAATLRIPFLALTLWLVIPALVLWRLRPERIR
jgi:ABC-2 type transport system permease protein